MHGTGHISTGSFRLTLSQALSIGLDMDCRHEAIAVFKQMIMQSCSHSHWHPILTSACVCICQQEAEDGARVTIASYGRALDRLSECRAELVGGLSSAFDICVQPCCFAPLYFLVSLHAVLPLCCQVISASTRQGLQ